MPDTIRYSDEEEMLLNPNSPWSKGKIGTQTDPHANIHTHTHIHTAAECVANGMRGVGTASGAAGWGCGHEDRTSQAETGELRGWADAVEGTVPGRRSETAQAVAIETQRGCVCVCVSVCL